MKNFQKLASGIDVGGEVAPADSELALFGGDLMRIDGDEITFNHGGRDSIAVRNWITRLKDALLALPTGKIEMPVEHIFARGMYVRKLFIPKGTLLVGKIHKQECVNIVSKGDISVLTESGSMRIQAGFHIVSPAGIQKVGFAHEDTIFTNVFLTDETDEAKIEDVIACDSYESLNKEVLICQ